MLKLPFIYVKDFICLSVIYKVIVSYEFTGNFKSAESWKINYFLSQFTSNPKNRTKLSTFIYKANHELHDMYVYTEEEEIYMTMNIQALRQTDTE